MADNSAFQLSRIYGQGWSAARKLLAQNSSGLEARGESLNPHDTTIERTRWNEGFQAALVSRAKSYHTPGGSSWRKAIEK